jgi:hypothetical protein
MIQLFPTRANWPFGLIALTAARIDPKQPTTSGIISARALARS